MRDNYVAKNANKFNIGGAHRDKSKYTRSTNLSKQDALAELDDDLELDWELERKLDCELENEYFYDKYDDLLTPEETVFMFQEPYQFEDFE
jgi:hypothetical protein